MIQAPIRRYLSLLTLLAIVGTIPAVCKRAQAAAPGQQIVGDEFRLPDTVAGQRLSAFLEMWNAISTTADSNSRDDVAIVRDFESKHRAVSASIPIEDRIAVTRRLRTQFGNLSPYSIIARAAENPLQVLAYAELSHDWLELTVLLTDDDHRKLIGVRMLPTESPSLRAISDSDWTDLDGLLKKVRKAVPIPAIGVVVANEEGVMAADVSGLRRSDREDQAALDSRFHIGSCGKPMTSTLIGALIERGVLDWQTTLGGALPHIEDILPDYRNVTIEQLLQHRAGIAREATGGWNAMFRWPGTADEQRERLARAVLTVKPLHPPGTTHLYSNAGYGIAGHMAEVATGRSWEELMQQHVFDPLGMRHSGIGPAVSEKRPNEPYDHFGPLAKPRPREVLVSGVPAAIAPAGDIHCSVTDLGKFLSAHLRGLRGGESGVLSRTTIRRLHTPPTQSDVPYGAGWTVRSEEDGEITHGHAGSAGSANAEMRIFEKANIAVAVAMNIEMTSEVVPTAQKIMKMVHARYAQPLRPPTAKQSAS